MRPGYRFISGPRLVVGSPRAPETVKFGAQRDLDYDIAKVRKLLRTDMSVEAMAKELGVTPAMLNRFIRRRRLCDMKERRRFIGLQHRIAGPSIEKHRKGEL